MTNTVKTLCIATFLAGLVTSSASQATAQAPMQGPMPGMGMMGRGGPGMGMMDRGMMRLMAECPMMGTDLATHTDGRIAFLKAELAITDAQKAGDFSAQLGPQVGTDAEGRPVAQGQIFDPFSIRRTAIWAWAGTRRSCCGTCAPICGSCC